MPPRARRVALLAPDLSIAAGVTRVALFLRRVLAASGRYEPTLISVATSSRDRASRRLAAPGTWRAGPRIVDETLEDDLGVRAPYRHVGADFVEVESFRYRPRPALTRLLSSFDLVQVVAGGPAWAALARGAGPPVALQVASLVRRERASALRRSRGLAGVWRRLATRAAERIESEALRNVDLVFVENPAMEEEIARRIGRERVVVAPPGVDTHFFAPPDGRPDARPAGGPLLAVGNLGDPRKNVSLLVRAYARLVAIAPDAPRLVLAGLGAPPAEDLALALSLGLDGRIEVRSSVTPTELRALYRSASAFVLSSDEEGFGLVVAEAMASGLPVAATRCGGPETLVVDGETGLLSPVGDADALAQSLATLASNPGRATAMGRAGRRRAVASFSIEATGPRFLEAWDRLLSG